MRFSRRSVLTISLITLFILLLNVSQDSKSIVNGFRFKLLDGFIAGAVETVSTVATYPFRKIKGFYSHYVALINLKKENEALIEELSFQKAYVLTLKERLRLNLEQEVVGNYYERLGLKGVFARVVGYDPFARSQTIWVSVGSKDGVKVDQPAITLQGLVGRVIKVESNVSQILTLVDSHFAVDAINQESRVRALIVGTGQNASIKRFPLMTHLEFLQLGDTLHAGDLFITSGLNGLYPEGIPIGNVIRVDKSDDELSQQAILPLVDFGKLEQVFIITEAPSLKGVNLP